ncbi:Kit ligand [Liparis tanakae]|uniref:Kit ligand n=1 Tax=Liparis tanakae TaxID=230148 RepID=A0A4Z2G5N4_9TELE|nr:Kit ligand [Liparis tanakae]
MKKPKIWIRVCVHILLFIALGVHSSRFDVNPVTDDISRLSILRQNIPKDYRIPVQYVTKEEGGMCWVKLNVFYLEESLQDLAHKFGNISSNRKDISIFIQMLQELRLNMGSLEPIMYDFECHYREERWQTERYFDLVKDFLIAAQNEEDSDDCDPPPCPTTSYTAATEKYLNDSKTSALTEVMERSLLSLLLIPLLALVFLLVWKVRSCRNEEDLHQNPGDGGLFKEVTAPPRDAEISEKNMLNVIEIDPPPPSCWCPEVMEEKKKKHDKKTTKKHEAEASAALATTKRTKKKMGGGLFFYSRFHGRRVVAVPEVRRAAPHRGSARLSCKTA